MSAIMSQTVVKIFLFVLLFIIQNIDLRFCKLVYSFYVHYSFLKSCGFPGTRALIIGIIMETNGGFFFPYAELSVEDINFDYLLNIDAPEMRHRVLYLGNATCQL